MSSVPVVIIGTIKDNDGSNEKQVTITGLAAIQGLHVGGGPIPPLWIWGGGNVPMPTPPIANVPGAPGFNPPIIWGPPGPWPTPPIAGIPGIPGYEPPKPGEPPREPKFESKVAWTPETGWIVVFVPTEGTNVPTPSAAGGTPAGRRA